ncbi:heme-binding beta-barrel domain-containing protein [Atopomonas sediminilitoris]|uniref:heme-binding beta-barrel domain-containing protein n=1 Tax=Atopomonas sediminilitoris TaxID=2919919 RepID=UPI001F4D764C|nr:heme-binding beta-barrel domain-containing protein [Atopomonas sediminilitoris]MCJ8167817.1 heme-binding beta-barrel domain-containing protein [Atopomonas sediminilitoris]
MSDTPTDAIDFGPLTGLLGTWIGDKGVDKSPEPDGEERSPYYEIITFSSADDVDNAEEQELVAVHYRQLVSRKSNDKIFHDESGYWIWDDDNQLLMNCFAIPRGISITAGGSAEEGSSDGQDSTILHVKAALGDADWPIAQSPFLRDKARTVSFERTFTLQGDSLIYKQTTVLEIYGRTFEHTDINRLTRAED